MMTLSDLAPLGYHYLCYGALGYDAV